MSTQSLQKQHAVDLHSQQAEMFASRYADPNADGYRDCFRYSRKRLQTYLDRYLPSAGNGLRLLDVGCGTGHHLAELRQRGFDGAGVDGSAEMLVEARQVNPGADLRQADVEALPFPDASFDVVICIEVLRYLPNPENCIREMARVLRPGGICLTTAAPLLNLNGYWLVNRLANLLPVGNLVRLKQFFATGRKLRRTFARSGFVSTKVHGVYLGPINWVERLVPRALPSILRKWERFDAAIADQRLLREFSNMFLVHAVRG
jgi:ubiquinone/menaquinone biosynthesis C-methylase UbiE